MTQINRNNVIQLPLPQVQVLTVAQYTSSLSIQQLAVLPRSLQFKERDRLETLIMALDVEIEQDKSLHITSLEYVQDLAIARYKAVSRMITVQAQS